MEGFWQFLGVLVWPAALIWFLWPLRDRLATGWPSLAKALGNLRRGSVELPGGVKAEVELQERADAPAAALPAAPANAGNHMTPVPPGQDEFVATIEGMLRQSLLQFPEGVHVDALVRATALARAQGNHEYVYNRIFGSQIKLLERLRVGSLTEAEVRDGYYAPAAAESPTIYAHYPFEKWANFPVSMLVVQIADGRYTITLNGVAFLSYLDLQDLAKDKVL